MLQLVLPAVEQWDERKQEFVYSKEQTLQLEHSLVSLSKWESKYNKPFLSKQEKTFEETLDYIRCMTITQNVNPDTYNRITRQHINQVNDYIDAPMTATTFSETKTGKRNNEIITSELIYYWMISLNIPFECQKWHLTRLITLIRVCSIKNAPNKRKSTRDVMSQYAALNAANRQRFNSKG